MDYQEILDHEMQILPAQQSPENQPIQELLVHSPAGSAVHPLPQLSAQFSGPAVEIASHAAVADVGVLTAESQIPLCE
jgi:hypothetical protein